MPLSYRLRKVVDSIELCTYLNGASLNIVSPIIMTNPNYYDKPQLLWKTPVIMTNPNNDSHNYYDSQDMVAPTYGHHDCTILYPLYDLNCKHQSGTLPKYNKWYASLLIVPCYEKKYITMLKN